MSDPIELIGCTFTNEVEDLHAEITRLRDDAETLEDTIEVRGVHIDHLRAENARLRALVMAITKCERESGVCVMVHDPERPECTAENCMHVAAALSPTSEESK